MERKILKKLIEWKNSKYRKPLILQGARQVGKTWIMKEFGRREFAKVAYVSFYHNERMKKVFDADFDMERILMSISAETNVVVTAGDTLIILDEIQEAAKALESLKYFCENASQYHVIAAGSLLGVAIHEGISYPVGKVDEMKMYPLSFEEFLLAMGENALAHNLANCEYKWMNDFGDKYNHWLKNYFYVGGMPEVVQRFADEKDYKEVRKLQNAIVNQYEKDFGKHSERDLQLRIHQVWNSIPMQLSKENKKFFFGSVKKGARMKDFELAIQWLENSGLVHKVNRVSKPGMPLKAYEELEAFKLFFLDVGLISAICNVSSKTIIDGNRMFTEFKGALTENYVLQELLAEQDFRLFYYSNDNSTFEIDFLLDHEDGPVPIEVKAEENLRAKSFKTYCEKFSPGTAIRTSMSPFREQEWMINLPLYAIGHMEKIFQ